MVDLVTQVVDRARDWAQQDERIVGALVHGSAARGDVTPLSDVDLVVVTGQGRRDQVWADRHQISEQLLDAEVVLAREVPHQRPYRWQARTADLRMLDLTLDEGALEMWPGLAAEVRFLVDEAGLEQQRADWLADHDEPAYDVVGEDDETWGLLAWLAAALLHGRVWLVRWALTDLIGRRVVTVTGRPGYALGSVDGDARLVARIDEALPTSFAADELARSLRGTAILYQDLVAEWASRTDSTPPASPLAPAVRDVLERLVTGEGVGLDP